MHTYQTNSGEVTVMSWDEYQRKKMSKYKNIITIVDGFKFDSKAEARYYGILKMRKLAGEIVDFKRQVPYDLVVNGISVGKYIADFLIQHADRKEVIDVKGVKTPIYNLKKRLMKAIYNIEIIEIK